MKLRYGIGLEQLLPAHDAAQVKANLPRSRWHRSPVAVVEPPPDPTAKATAAAIARLGRGHGLGRGWRP